MKMWQVGLSLGVTGLALGLVACGGNPLVGGRTAPDETRVVDGPSLAIPPDFDLRPPREGEDYSSRLNRQKTQEAEEIITGGSSVNAGAAGADDWLLQEVEGEADPSIRQTLEEGYKVDKQEKNKSWWERQSERMFGEDEDTD